MSNKEQSIQRALDDLEPGLLPFLRESTQYHRVPNSTAAHRRAGRRIPFHLLLDKLEKANTTYKYHEFLSSSVYLAWSKLNE